MLGWLFVLDIKSRIKESMTGNRRDDFLVRRSYLKNSKPTRLAKIGMTEPKNFHLADAERCRELLDMTASSYNR
jgi:hypothetical protein